MGLVARGASNGDPLGGSILHDELHVLATPFLFPSTASYSVLDEVLHRLIYFS